MPTEAEIIEAATAFTLKIDFVPNRGDPARPFQTLAKLIEAFKRFDRNLVRSIDVNIESGLVLESVEAGSIKARFLELVKLPSDASLKSGEPKKIIGDFLVEGRKLLVDALEKAETVADDKLLTGLQSDLLAAAERTDVRGLPGYAALTKAEVAGHIVDVTDALQYLEEGDMATLEDGLSSPRRFNPAVNVGESEIAKLSDILAVRILQNTATMILKIKKPDYTGRSMWEFHYEGRIIEASIADMSFLASFQATGMGIRPGSALRAQVDVTASYDEENNSLPSKYVILAVEEIIPPPSGKLNQLSLPA